jgi:hypothetical protein
MHQGESPNDAGLGKINVIEIGRAATRTAVAHGVEHNITVRAPPPDERPTIRGGGVKPEELVVDRFHCTVRNRIVGLVIESTMPVARST